MAFAAPNLWYPYRKAALRSGFDLIEGMGSTDLMCSENWKTTEYNSWLLPPHLKKLINSQRAQQARGTPCKHLGIDLFNQNFYGGGSMAVHSIRQRSEGMVSMSLSEARSHLFL
jgi:hypothetical protein